MNDFAHCTGTNQYGDCGILNSNVFSMTIVICLYKYHEIVLYGVINHLIQKAGGEFPDFEIYSDRKDCTLSRQHHKECLTAAVIMARSEQWLLSSRAGIQKEISK